MKKPLLLILVVLLACGVGFAQESGTGKGKNKKQKASVSDTTMTGRGDVQNEDNSSSTIGEGQDDDTENGSGTYVPSLLHSSQDVYVNNTSYTFSIAYFRPRGYDNKYQDVCMNGFSMNSRVTQRASYSQWGGLNHIFRYPENIVNLNPVSFTFGNVNGASNYNLRASNFRRQLRATYSLSNRSYNNRFIVSGGTGVMKIGGRLAQRTIRQRHVVRKGHLVQQLRRFHRRREENQLRELAQPGRLHLLHVSRHAVQLRARGV